MSLNQSLTAFASRSAVALAMLHAQIDEVRELAVHAIVAEGVLGDAAAVGFGPATDNAPFIQAAVDMAAARGGGAVLIPWNGTGIVRVGRQIVLSSNVTITAAKGVIIDKSPLTGSSLFSATGSIGSEVELGVAAVKTDRVLTTAAPHGMEVGDYFLLKGVLNVLSFADCGPELILGRATNTQKLYPGEFHRVAASSGDTNIQMRAGVIMPHGYGTSQVGSGDRACSTVAKVDFIENVWIEELDIRSWRSDTSGDVGTTVCFFRHARKSGVKNTKFDQTTYSGASVDFRDCLDCEATYETEHDPSYTWAEHQLANSGKVSGSQNTYFHLVDRYGAQGVDETYFDGGHTCVNTTLSGLSLENREDGVTSHGGSAFSRVDGFIAINCHRAGINWRAPLGACTNFSIIGGTTEGESGVRVGSLVHSLSVDNFYIDGCPDGIYVHFEISGAALRRDIEISAGQIVNCRRGVNLQNSINATAVHSGISMSALAINRAGDYAIRVGNYINGVIIDSSVTIGPVNGPASGQRYGVILAANAVQCTVRPGLDNLGGNVIGVWSTAITDATTFPAHLYPNGSPRHTLDCDVKGPLMRLYDVPGIRSMRPTTPGATKDYGGAGLAAAGSYYDSLTLAGAADGKVASFFAIWRFTGAASSTARLISNSDNRFSVWRTSTGGVVVVGYNASGVEILRATTTDTPMSAAGTYAVWVSFDLATAGSIRIRVMNLDTLTENSGDFTITTFTDDSIDFTAAEWSIGAAHDGANRAGGDAYMVWLDTSQRMEFGDCEVRGRFIDHNGVPRYLGADGEYPGDAQPILFLAYDTQPDWKDNKGSAGGTFTANGTPANPSTQLRGMAA